MAPTGRKPRIGRPKSGRGIGGSRALPCRRSVQFLRNALDRLVFFFLTYPTNLVLFSAETPLRKEPRMKRIGTFVVAVVLAGSLVPAAYAEDPPTNKWDAGYPKTGNNQGTILIKGKATFNQGWAPISGSYAAWPVGGGPATTGIVTVRADGSW